MGPSLYLSLRPFVFSVALLPDEVLLPPPQDPTGPCNPLRPGTQLKYWVCRNVIRNCCLPPPNIFPYWPHPLRLYNLFFQVPFPTLLPNAPVRLPHYHPRYMMVKRLQHILHCLRYHPTLDPA